MSENAPPPTEHHTAEDLLPTHLRRFAPLLGAIAIGIGLFGFLTGIREPSPTPRPDPVVSTAPDMVPSAVRYAELPTKPLGPNANWGSSVASLKFNKPGIFDPVIRTQEMKLAAIADRAQNRAYDGAPPTIPHPVEAQSAASCLACHGEGLKVGDRIASRMSHPYLSNCTQCHVEQTPATPFTDNPSSIENSFVGVYRAGPGDRASPGAPPTIPHHTWMRQDCASCHGLVTRPGLRTTHPWLTNCTQCHAPSAHLNQVDFLGMIP